MSDKLHPLPLKRLLGWMLRDLERGHVFGLSRNLFFTPEADDVFRISRYGKELETPIGVAAGPHTQLSQNIVAAWLMGARYIELKTIQTLDQIEVTKPCIEMEDEGYNCEWSQELTVGESFNEYLNAWIAIHVLRHKFGWPNSPESGVIFNMSAGYDHAGIMQDNVQWFLDKMRDCRAEKNAKVEEIRSIYPAIGRVEIPDCISDNITLSTMHGCPPEEIEKIARYFIGERRLHTTVKLNPTLLGADRLRGILNDQLGSDVVVPDTAFEHDPKYDEALSIVKSLKRFAEESGVDFGVKLTNTLEVENKKHSLPENEELLYLSGRLLHPISVNLAAKLEKDFRGELDISFCAGADCFNIGELIGCNLAPVTVCSDLLKPGGYTRLRQYLTNIEASVSEYGAGSIGDFIIAKSGTNSGKLEAGAGNLDEYSQATLNDNRYHKQNIPFDSFKGEQALGYFDCIFPPCQDSCAISQDVPGYMFHTSRGDFSRALKVIRADNPLPAITGHVCDRQCEPKCVRVFYDEPVGIREIKRFNSSKARPEVIKNNIKSCGKSAGIIGAGPSGLSCAYFLAMAGFNVELFEVKESAGGMASNAIPKFRLDEMSIAGDIGAIERLGVKINYGVNIDRVLFDQLRTEKDYVYIAAGAQKSKELEIPGEDSTGVLDHLSFLQQARKGSITGIGPEAAIIGGGNSAIDAARTAKRMVGESGKVAVIYRRTRSEMPVDREELTEMMEEGIELLELTTPKVFRILDNGRISVGCVKLTLGDKDSSGRPRPVEIEGSDFTLEFDTVIPAIGQEVVLDFLPDEPLSVNSQSNKTQYDNLYAGGDAVRGASTLIKAIADGKNAAMNIIRTAGVSADFNEPDSVKGFSFDELQQRKSFRRYSQIKHPEFDPAMIDLDTVRDNLDDETTKLEADRCLYCDELCNLCVSVCPNLANIGYRIEPAAFDLYSIVNVQDGVSWEKTGQLKVRQSYQIINFADFCNECGNCTTFCPTSGSPFIDKPRFYLSEESFRNENDGYYLSGKTLYSRSEGHEERISLNGDELEYENPGLLVVLNAEDLSPKEVRIKNRAVIDPDLSRAAEMYILLKPLSDHPLFRER